MEYYNLMEAWDYCFFRGNTFLVITFFLSSKNCPQWSSDVISRSWQILWQFIQFPKLLSFKRNLKSFGMLTRFFTEGLVTSQKTHWATKKISHVPRFWALNGIYDKRVFNNLRDLPAPQNIISPDHFLCSVPLINTVYKETELWPKGQIQRITFF